MSKTSFTTNGVYKGVSTYNVMVSYQTIAGEELDADLAKLEKVLKDK